MWTKPYYMAIVLWFISPILISSISTSSTNRSPHQILNVPRTATEKQIKHAYRELAKKYHPDKTNNDPKSAQKFIEIQNAYETLTSPQSEQSQHQEDYHANMYQQHQHQQRQQYRRGHGGGDTEEEIYTMFTRDGRMFYYKSSSSSSGRQGGSQHAREQFYRSRPQFTHNNYNFNYQQYQYQQPEEEYSMLYILLQYIVYTLIYYPYIFAIIFALSIGTIYYATMAIIGIVFASDSSTPSNLHPEPTIVSTSLPPWRSKLAQKGVIAIICKNDKSLIDQMLVLRSKFRKDPVAFYSLESIIGDDEFTLVALAKGGKKWAAITSLSTEGNAVDYEAWIVQLLGGELQWHVQDNEPCPIHGLQ